MKVLIAASFYSEYELYDTDDPTGLISDIKRMEQGQNVDMNKYKLLGYQDTIETHDALKMADLVYFIDNND